MAKLLEFKAKDTAYLNKKFCDDGEEEMVPVDEWNGECWKTLFEQFCVPVAKESNSDPWDILANFIKIVYDEKGENK